MELKVGQLWYVPAVISGSGGMMGLSWMEMGCLLAAFPTTLPFQSSPLGNIFAGLGLPLAECGPVLRPAARSFWSGSSLFSVLFCDFFSFPLNALTVPKCAVVSRSYPSCPYCLGGLPSTTPNSFLETAAQTCVPPEALLYHPWHWH